MGRSVASDNNFQGRKKMLNKAIRKLQLSMKETETKYAKMFLSN